MKLDDLFKAIKDKMLVDFTGISAQVQHRGAKGRLRERTVIGDFLEKYLPGNIGISSGEIFSSDDQVSPECDVVLYDRLGTPFLLQTEGYQVFPVECVHGVIEVRSNLDTPGLEQAYSRISTIKKMPKLAFEKQTGPVIKSTKLYDREWEEFFPTLGFVISFQSVDLKILRDALKSLSAKDEPHHRIDSVWVLNQGSIINYNSVADRIELAPGRNTQYRAILSDNPLMAMTIQMQTLLQGAWLSQFKISKYLSDATHGHYYD